MVIRTFHRWYDEDSDKWLVLNECDEFEAGPFEKAEEADAWIEQQNAINEWTDS